MYHSFIDLELLYYHILYYYDVLCILLCYTLLFNYFLYDVFNIRPKMLSRYTSHLVYLYKYV